MRDFTIKDVLSGNVLGHQWLRRQYLMIFLVSGLIFLYIYCEYQSQRQQRELNNLKKELKEVRLRKLMASTELLGSTRRSNVIELLNAHGSELKESTIPAIRIQ
jgi:hypothetical protein